MLFVILYSIICVLIGVFIFVYADTKRYGSSNFYGKVIGALIGFLFSWLTFYHLAGLTGGADKHYGFGRVRGVVTQVESVGTFYKTTEMKLRQGYGEHAQFIDISFGKKQNMDIYIGQNIEITYSKYFIPDFKLGESPLVGYTDNIIIIKHQ